MKLKKLASLIITTTLALSPVWANAQDLVPKMINLEAVLVDDGGNVLKETQEGDITFSIVDATNTVVYEEIQRKVPIIKGAISVQVGSGDDKATGSPTGGIPYELLDPSSGDKILRFKLDDQTVPQEDVEITSTPFTYFAQYAMQLKNPITSDQILDGTLAVADLSSEVLDLINQGKSEPTLPIAAKYVSINGSLTYASGSDVQEVVRGFDNTLGVQVARIENLEKGLADETQARKDADKKLTDDLAVEVQARKDGDTTLQKNLNQEISDRKDGDQAEANARIAGDQNLQNQVTSHEGRITTIENAGYITDGNQGWNNEYGFITAADIPPPPDLSPYIKRTGDTMSGNLDMNDADCQAKGLGNCKVDTVDVSELDGRVYCLQNPKSQQCQDFCKANPLNSVCLDIIKPPQNSPVWTETGFADDEFYTPIINNYNFKDCTISFGLVAFDVDNGIDRACAKACRDDANKRFRIRCFVSTNDNGGNGSTVCGEWFNGNIISDNVNDCDPLGGVKESCRVVYRVMCIDPTLFK